MDYVDPLRAIVPGVPGAVLSVLAHTEQPLTLRQLAQRAGSSHPQVALHVERLERLGLVRRHVVGRSHLVAMTDSYPSQVLRELADLRSAVLEQFATSAARITPEPASVVVFGSFARGTARADSDIDVLIVRPAAVAADDNAWTASIDAWVDEMSELSASPLAEVVVAQDELSERLDAPLGKAIRSEGILVAGRDLAELGHAA